MHMIEALFGTQTEMTGTQECARAVLVFCYGLLLLRASGRRIFGRWAALDIIVSIVIGSNLSRAITGNAPLLSTLAATTLMMAMHWALAQLAARSPFVSRLVEGRAIELGDGGVLRTHLRRLHAVSEPDLQEALRKSNVEHVEDAARIVLEPSGAITVLKRR